MVQLLIDNDANPEQQLLLEDLILLGRLKGSKSSVKKASQNLDTTGYGSRLPLPEMLAASDLTAGLLDSEKYRQFGQKGIIKLIPEFIKGKKVSLFEMAATHGDFQIASLILGMYEFEVDEL